MNVCINEYLKLATPLPRSFYRREATDVAPDLLNKVLVRVTQEGCTAGRIAEVEAYTQDDAASHSHRGETPRNRVMFGEAGRSYVYFTYGMHYCLNTVTGLEASGQGVLIRAVQPIAGMELMAARRGLSGEVGSIRAGRSFGSGPAILCKSFGITTAHSGIDLTERGELYIVESQPLEDEAATGKVIATTRIGITRDVDLLRRYLRANDLYVSRKP